MAHQGHLRPVTAAALLAFACLCFPVAALADDSVKLTLDGRPVDRNGGSAVMRAGTIFADAIDLTKSFDGFITLARNGGAMITIGPNTGTFAPGQRRATINAAAVQLPAAPFVRNGDLFVPLGAFINKVAAARLHFNRMRHCADIRVSGGAM